VALQLRNLQTLVDIGVDKSTTVVSPAPLMSTIGELGSFLAGETAAAGQRPWAASDGAVDRLGTPATVVPRNGRAASAPDAPGSA
jgi:hypothetical protein